MKEIKKASVIIAVGIIYFTAFTYADLYKRAPEALPGTLPEMRDPAYWIERMDNPDEVILAPETIRQMNESYVEKMSSPEPFKGAHPDRLPRDDKANRLDRWPGRFLVMPDIRSMKPDTISVITKEKIREDIDFLRQQKVGNFLAVEYSDNQIDALEDEMAIEHVPDEIVFRDGIAVRTTRLRIVPSFFPGQVGLMNNEKYRWDIWTANLVKIGKPVVVLHASRSGAYVFALSEEGYGWVESQDIAFGHILEIKAYNNPENFIVCTGDRVPFYSDKRCRYASGWLRMGDRVPIASRENPRIISVPVRSVNGKFSTETAWLAEDADISVGWLPYSRRNIVETAFKLLDNPYDWTMAYLGRNHETTYRDIFACFGFKLPFHGSLFTHFGDNNTVILPDIGREKQYAMILENEPFVTLQCSRSNVRILLGEYNGEPIAFNTNGYGYTDENGIEYEIKRTCITDTRMPSYFLKNPITVLVLK